MGKNHVRGEQVKRQWAIVQHIAASYFGRTLAQLTSAIGQVTDRTIRRDLEMLQDAGLIALVDDPHLSGRRYKAAPSALIKVAPPPVGEPLPEGLSAGQRQAEPAPVPSPRDVPAWPNEPDAVAAEQLRSKIVRLVIVDGLEHAEVAARMGLRVAQVHRAMRGR